MGCYRGDDLSSNVSSWNWDGSLTEILCFFKEEHWKTKAIYLTQMDEIDISAPNQLLFVVMWHYATPDASGLNQWDPIILFLSN